MIYLMGYSVLVDNEDQARKLQEIAIEQGFKWSTREGIGFLSEKSFQFGGNGKKRITYSYGGNHYQDKFITKKAHFNDLFKEETLQEKEQRLLKELEKVRKEIEDSKIKKGDWVWNALNESYYKKTSGLYGIGERKITNQELIKLLEQELINKLN